MSELKTRASQDTNESSESFQDVFAEYERSTSLESHAYGSSREGTVITVLPDSVLIDVGFKTEGALARTAFGAERQLPKPGDKLLVSVKGRDPQGYYELVLGKVAHPTDWGALEKAFAEKTTIIGTVTAVVKGGVTVDVGVRTFMPASRSGTRSATELQGLVDQEIRCRVIKLDATEEDVVVDRRVVLEDEERANQQRRYCELKEGDVVHGIVRSLTGYGAFIDLGGVDGLMHVSDMAWRRVAQASELLAPGQLIEAKVLRVSEDAGKRRISLGMKQLQPDPWETAARKYRPGEKITGVVTRVADFGAFVELEPGIEGLIHVSEMSWARKVKKAGDLVSPGDRVETIILGVNPAERRMSLGLKQALGDPWANITERLTAGSIVTGTVVSLTSFGAFLELGDGIEGMVHVTDMSAEKSIKHPQDVLKIGQSLTAQVLELDVQRRRIRLGIRQMAPTSIEEYIAEHHERDVVSGRVVEVSNEEAAVELGDGIRGRCQIHLGSYDQRESVPDKVDLASLTSRLKAHWKGSSSGGSHSSHPEPVRAGQMRSFRIIKLDRAVKQIELELA